MNRAQGPVLPFRLNTRQRIQPIGTLSVTPDATARLEIPKVGFLSGLLLQVRGTVTFSAAGVLTDLAPWSLIRRLVVGTNLGALNLVDLSGYGLYLANLLRTPDSRVDVAGQTYAVPTAIGAQTWNIALYVPIAANNGDEFDLGLINLQAAELQAFLTVQWGSLAELATNVTAQALHMDVSYIYYEVPQDPSVKWPPQVLHRLVEEVQTINSTGENAVTLLRQGIILRLIHMLRINGARSNAIDTLGLRINKTDNIYQINRAHVQFMHQFRYLRELPTGVFVHDWWNSGEEVNRGDFRDAIDSEFATNTESVLTVTPGTVLGTNNNFVHTIRQFVQALQ